MCCTRSAATCSAGVLQKPASIETDSIFQQSFRVFSLLPEVFNAAANNLVTIRQSPDTSPMAGLAKVSASQPSHSSLHCNGSWKPLLPPRFFSEATGLCSLPFVNMHLWTGADVILLSAWFRQVVSCVLQRQPGCDFSQMYNQSCFQMVSACPPLGQHCRISL